MSVAPPPVFLLGPPRCQFATLCATIAQHPQMYALPQTHLFSAPTMSAWWEMCSRSRFNTMDHGLLRAVAQLVFSEQTDWTVAESEGWLRRRSHCTTSYIFELLCDRVAPLVVVDKSPTLVSNPANLRRVLRMFPHARFIHVVQHPRGFAENLTAAIAQAAENGPVPYWMLELASFPPNGVVEGARSEAPSSGLDPQYAWLALHTNTATFLASVPQDQQIMIRLEDLERDRQATLRRVADFLALRADDESIEQMQHPERSCYSSFGPPRARFGNETFFLQAPQLQPAADNHVQHVLDGPLSWRRQPQGFLPEVKRLARQFGYD